MSNNFLAVETNSLIKYDYRDLNQNFFSVRAKIKIWDRCMTQKQVLTIKEIFVPIIIYKFINEKLNIQFVSLKRRMS